MIIDKWVKTFLKKCDHGKNGQDVKFPTGHIQIKIM